jgi:hypothetical protein
MAPGFGIAQPQPPEVVEVLLRRAPVPPFTSITEAQVSLE